MIKLPLKIFFLINYLKKFQLTSNNLLGMIWIVFLSAALVSPMAIDSFCQVYFIFVAKNLLKNLNDIIFLLTDLEECLSDICKPIF